MPSATKIVVIKPNRIMKKLLFAALFAVLVSVMVTSCNVTRTVTTTSQFFQRGDTTMTIQTKTIESYDATKKPNF